MTSRFFAFRIQKDEVAINRDGQDPRGTGFREESEISFGDVKFKMPMRIQTGMQFTKKQLQNNFYFIWRTFADELTSHHQSCDRDFALRVNENWSVVDIQRECCTMRME